MNKVLPFPVPSRTLSTLADSEAAVVPLSFQGPAPDRGVYVKQTDIPGRSTVAVVDSHGVTKLWAEMGTDFCTERLIWALARELDAADPVDSEASVVGVRRLTPSSGVVLPFSSASASPSRSQSPPPASEASRGG
jgi:hypothetical protein